MFNRLSLKGCIARGVIMAGALTVGAFANATTYVVGESPLLSASPPGTFDLGTHLANYVGSSQEEGNGTALDGTRVYLLDVNDPLGVQHAAVNNFHLLVWKFSSLKDSVRLYTHQDHFTGGPIGGNAPEVLEYSVWGCNSLGVNLCNTQGEWSLLSDPDSFALDGNGLPTYGFFGTAPTTIFRGGSSEFHLVNAYVQDFTFANSYDYFAIRGSSIAMQANTADPELDAMVAFNRVDFPDPNSVPAPGVFALLLSGIAGVLARRRRS